VWKEKGERTTDEKGQGGKRRQVIVNHCQEPKKVQGKEMMFVKTWYLSILAVILQILIIKCCDLAQVGLKFEAPMCPSKACNKLPFALKDRPGALQKPARNYTSHWKTDQVPFTILKSPIHVSSLFRTLPIMKIKHRSITLLWKYDNLPMPDKPKMNILLKISRVSGQWKFTCKITFWFWNWLYQYFNWSLLVPY